MKNASSAKVRKLTAISMLTAMAYVTLLFIRFKFQFLTYDVKDIIIMLGGLCYGPIPAIAMSGVLSVIEMISLSETGVIGMIMNFLSTVSFVIIPVIVVRKKQMMKSLLLALLCGVLFMTAVMILFNILISPIYFGQSRKAIIDMIMPILLPFNMIKGFLNASISLLILPSLLMAVKKAGAESDIKINDFYVKKSNFIAMTIISSICIVIGIILFVIFK